MRLSVIILLLNINNSIQRDLKKEFCDRVKKGTYRKSSIKPPGGLFNFGPSRGGLNREGGLLERGGLFTKSKDKDIFDSFLVLSTQILRNQHTILRLKYINSTQFLSQTILKLTRKVVQINGKHLVTSRILYKWGGLIERGGLFQILTQRGGAY